MVLRNTLIFCLNSVVPSYPGITDININPGYLKIHEVLDWCDFVPRFGPTFIPDPERTLGSWVMGPS